MCIGIYQLDCSIAHLSEATIRLGTPGKIDLTGVARTTEAFEQRMSDDRALVCVQFQSVSDQSGSGDCHHSSVCRS